jgi:hypothetical protein
VSYIYPTFASQRAILAQTGKIAKYRITAAIVSTRKGARSLVQYKITF